MVTRVIRDPATALSSSPAGPNLGYPSHSLACPSLLSPGAKPAHSLKPVRVMLTVSTLDGYVEILPLQCPSPAFAALEQGVDHLNQSLVLDQSVQLVVLASGEMPFKVEEALELPAGRNLTIVGNSSRNGDARVKVNITEEFKVNGALQLERLELSGGSGSAWSLGIVGGTAAAGISGTIPSGERVAADAWTVCGALIEVYRLFCCDDREP